MDGESPKSEAEGGSSTYSHVVEDLSQTDPKFASDSPQIIHHSLSSMDCLLFFHLRLHKYVCV